MNKKIYLAGGCYWGTEHFLKLVDGVLETTVGFAQGHKENPTYAEVRQLTTGHTETVETIYDADKVGLEKLLNLFFHTIDPTALNHQGEDEGENYRTGIYFVDSEDESVIRNCLSELQKQYDEPIVVEVEPLRCFYPAHEEHQDYLEKNPQGYCHISPDLFELARRK